MERQGKNVSLRVEEGGSQRQGENLKKKNPMHSIQQAGSREFSRSRKMER